MIRPDVDKLDKHLVNDIATFDFCGYDLVEMDTCISTITNCGANFENAIGYGNLNDCEVVEVWRKLI